MAKLTYEKKYSLAMSGEHFVAAELLRLGLQASVTLGNAKQADVVVMNAARDKVAVVEVKTSETSKWVLGGTIPARNNQLWVFVQMTKPPSSPNYFIVFGHELHDILSPKDIEWRKEFLKRNGHEFSKRGVVSVQHSEIAHFRNRWSAIQGQVT